MSTAFASDYQPPFPQLSLILQFDQERLGPFAGGIADCV